MQDREAETRGVLQRLLLCAFVFLCCLAPLQALLGCSGTSRYRVLSFFLDGVPDPYATEKSGTGSVVHVSKQGQTYYIHKPLIDGSCGQCHDKSPTAIVSGKVTLPPEICRQCHAKVDEAYTVVHGPVASNQCVGCHLPHRSTIPHLLKAEGAKLCLQCHMPFDLSTRVKEHSDLKIDCMSCHNSHGGADHALLKPASASPTTTQPAESSASLVSIDSRSQASR